MQATHCSCCRRLAVRLVTQLLLHLRRKLGDVSPYVAGNTIESSPHTLMSVLSPCLLALFVMHSCAQTPLSHQHRARDLCMRQVSDYRTRIANSQILAQCACQGSVCILQAQRPPEALRGPTGSPRCNFVHLSSQLIERDTVAFLRGRVPNTVQLSQTRSGLRAARSQIRVCRQLLQMAKLHAGMERTQTDIYSTRQAGMVQIPFFDHSSVYNLASSLARHEDCL